MLWIPRMPRWAARRWMRTASPCAPTSPTPRRRTTSALPATPTTTRMSPASFTSTSSRCSPGRRPAAPRPPWSSSRPPWETSSCPPALGAPSSDSRPGTWQL